MTAPTLANLIAYSAQVLIIVAAGALGALAVRLPRARARLAYWRLILGACLALPLLAQRTDQIVFTPVPSVDVLPATDEVPDVAETPLAAQVSAAEVVGLALLGGVAGRVAWLGLGILALMRLRRQGRAAALDEDLETLRKAVAPDTTICWHAAIQQPVAFGWRRPVVLLPERTASLPYDAQRAVICHELLHVERRDWLWMLGEEVIRCLFWFHPAIWFALAKLELGREELVDERVVEITGVRQPYVRALAMFAGEPEAFAAATPFIRRRHLISRIRQLSEDHTMSRLRIACGLVVLIGVIGVSGWTAASAVPLRAAGTTRLPVPSPNAPALVSLQPVDPGAPSLVDSPAGAQDAVAVPANQFPFSVTINTPNDLRPDEVAEKLRSLPAVAAQLQALADAQRRATQEVRMVHLAAQAGSPADAATYRVSPVYPEAAKGHGVDAVVTLRVTVGTAGEVTNVEVVRTRLSTERDVTDPTFWASQPSRLFGQAAEDAVRQWRFEPNGTPGRFEMPVALSEQQPTMVFTPAVRVGTTALASGTPGVITYAPDAQTRRIRVGGAIRPPTQVSKVAPEYPAAAKTARVEGVVIIEAVIGTDGGIHEAHVLRSIPLLDHAALDAVRQWKYQPTLLNGVAVEVIMTVVVNFTLPPQF